MQHSGNLTASDLKFAIVCSRFNDFITSKLLDGAEDCILRHGGDKNNIDIIWTPGCFEIPLIASTAAQSGKYDGVICLGVILQGATSHNAYVAAEVTKGIAQIQLQTGLPVGYGIVNADSLEQAIERAGSKMGNRGWEAALATIEMAQLLKALA